jgi:hypothetical protein
MPLPSYLPGGPASNGFAITPVDNVAFVTNPRGIYVGTTGDLAVIMAQDSATTLFKAVPAGSLLPISVKVVMSTNTTASNLVGVF